MIKLYTDAAFHPVNQKGGIGIRIEANKNVELKYHIPYCENNHIIEFQAVMLGLKYILENFDDDTIVLYSDSKIVIDSIDKKFVKNPLFRPVFEEIMKIIVQFDLFFTQWIADSQNKTADFLAKQALHQKGNYFLVDQN